MITGFRPLLLTLALLVVFTAAAQEEEAAEGPLRVDAPKTTEPMRIDGLLVEPIWEQATVVHVHFNDKQPGVPVKEVEATMRVVWDDYYLYLGYTVADPDVLATGSGEIQGPEGNRREGVVAHPDKPNDFVEFFISFGDPHFFWEIHHDAANNFNDVWCTVPGKDWPLATSTMHLWGIHFAHREFIEDDGAFTLKMAVALTNSRDRRRTTVNDSSDEDFGWSAEIRLPWGSIGVPKSTQSWLHPNPENKHFRVRGPFKMEGQTVNLLTVLHRGELPERYYHSSPTRKGDWFHKTFDDWPIFTFTDPAATATE